LLIISTSSFDSDLNSQKMTWKAYLLIWKGFVGRNFS